MSLVLLYHRVAAPEVDPYGLAVSPDRFAAHVEALSRMRNTVPLEEVVRPGSSRRVAITFDDGYADNATVAAPLLADAGLPATWFITTGTLGRRRFWWDRLCEALLGSHPVPEYLDVWLAERNVWLDLRNRDARRDALLFLHRRLLPLTPEEIHATVDTISQLLGAPTATDQNLTMTVEQLRVMSRLPLQDVGAHTRSHAHLSSQPAERQREEILGSVADLEALLQRPVRSFAYPFGGPAAVGRHAPRLVAEAGCRVACTTLPGSIGRRSDRHRLPRLTVLDWPEDEFITRVGAVLRHG